MVSEPFVPANARAEVSPFARISAEVASMSAGDVLKKVARVCEDNVRRRESAADTWAKWFLPSVRELHAARAARALGVQNLAPGTIVAGVMILDEADLRFAVEDAERCVHVHAIFIRHTLDMIPVNKAWIEVALADLQRRGDQ